MKDKGIKQENTAEQQQHISQRPEPRDDTPSPDTPTIVLITTRQQLYE